MMNKSLPVPKTFQWANKSMMNKSLPVPKTTTYVLKSTSYIVAKALNALPDNLGSLAKFLHFKNESRTLRNLQFLYYYLCSNWVSNVTRLVITLLKFRKRRQDLRAKNSAHEMAERSDVERLLQRNRPVLICIHLSRKWFYFWCNSVCCCPQTV